MDPQTTDDGTRKKQIVSRNASPSRSNQDLTRKSSEFWFNDGNVVLQTKTTQYRIHSSLLSIQSSVFEDMFAIPQPEQSAQPLLEGCSVVLVTDSAEDWDALLGLLYNTERHIPNTHIFPLATIFAMLRLGEKYNFAQFKAGGFRQLQHIFPEKLHLQDGKSLDPVGKAEIIGGHEFKTLRAIEDLQIWSALPMAYLSCIYDRNLEEIASGRDTPDGPIFLSEQTRNVLTLGKQRLIATYPTFAFTWLWAGKPCPSCEDAEGCKNKFKMLMDGVLKDPTDLRRFFQVDAYVNLILRSRLCHPCKDVASSRFPRVLKTIFHILPSYFDLPAWNQLKDL